MYVCTHMEIHVCTVCMYLHTGMCLLCYKLIIIWRKFSIYFYRIYSERLLKKSKYNNLRSKFKFLKSLPVQYLRVTMVYSFCIYPANHWINQTFFSLCCRVLPLKNPLPCWSPGVSVGGHSRAGDHRPDIPNSALSPASQPAGEQGHAHLNRNSFSDLSKPLPKLLHTWEEQNLNQLSVVFYFLTVERVKLLSAISRVHWRKMVRKGCAWQRGGNSQCV